MKKTVILTGILGVMALTSCVSLKEHESLQSKYDQTEKRYKLALQECEDLRAVNANLTLENGTLRTDYNALTNAKERCDGTVDSLSRRIEQMRRHYDTTMENYLQEVAGKNRDLNRAQNLLSARTKELNNKERELEQKETELEEQQHNFNLQRNQLIAKQRELERQEAATRAQLEAKEHELDAIRNSVTQALVGFADKGLKVETKDGKVYVSMENKLMFASASWTVSKEGAYAIKELAKVLESDTTLNIMVEGHTDNVAYRGSTAVKDNWDLSVMRATSIVKLLLQYGPNINPARIEASGHGEYAPKASNETAEGKAANRRTEIILTPKLSDLMNLIEQ